MYNVNQITASLESHRLNPAILIPAVEELINQEHLTKIANETLRNDIQMLRNDLLITQLELLLSILRVSQLRRSA